MVIIWLMMANNNLVSGRPTPLQNDGGVKSVGMIIYSIPNMMGKIIQSCSSHHQAVSYPLVN